MGSLRNSGSRVLTLLLQCTYILSRAFQSNAETQLAKRFRQIATSHLFLLQSGKVLILRRFNTGYEDGNYSVPAGHIDAAESATQTIVREAWEEIGVGLNVKKLRLVHVMHRWENQERIDLFFKCRQWHGQPRILEPDKCDDLKWCRIRKLPRNTVSYIRQAVRSLTKNMPYSERGWAK